MHLRRTPYLMWAPLAQAEQPGGVVNLAIGENNAANMRAAQNLFLIQFWRMGNLLADIGEALHSTHSLPLSLTMIDDWVRGSPEGYRRANPDSWRSYSSTGETTASGGTEDFNKHEDEP